MLPHGTVQLEDVYKEAQRVNIWGITGTIVKSSWRRGNVLYQVRLDKKVSVDGRLTSDVFVYHQDIRVIEAGGKLVAPTDNEESVNWESAEKTSEYCQHMDLSGVNPKSKEVPKCNMGRDWAPLCLITNRCSDYVPSTEDSVEKMIERLIS